MSDQLGDVGQAEGFSDAGLLQKRRGLPVSRVFPRLSPGEGPFCIWLSEATLKIVWELDRCGHILAEFLAYCYLLFYKNQTAKAVSLQNKPQTQTHTRDPQTHTE